MFNIKSPRTLLDFHVEWYNTRPLEENWPVLHSVFNQYQLQPTKSFLEIDSILPLAKLTVDQPNAAELIKQLLENLRQNIVSSTLESRVYFYGLLNVFQLADSRLFTEEYWKESVRYIAHELGKSKNVNSQNVALILLLLEQWRRKTNNKASLDRELSKQIVNLLSAKQAKLHKKNLLNEAEASLPFLISHTLNLVKLMTEPSDALKRIYHSYIHPALSLVGAIGEQELKIVPIVAGFTYLAATGVVLATPIGWAIAGAALTGIIGYVGLYKGITGWWDNTKKEWDTYQTLPGDEASYLFCKSVLETLECLKDLREADKWEGYFDNLSKHLSRKDYWNLHAPLASVISMVFLNYLSSLTRDERKIKAAPWIALCVALYAHKYPQRKSWLMALATLSHHFTSLEPFITQQFEKAKSSHISKRYETTQKQINEEFSKAKNLLPESMPNIILINQQQEEWLQKAGAFTFSPLRNYYKNLDDEEVEEEII